MQPDTFDVVIVGSGASAAARSRRTSRAGRARRPRRGRSRASTRAPTSTPMRCRSTSPTARSRRCGRARQGSTRSAAAASAARRCCGMPSRCGSASATSRDAPTTAPARTGRSTTRTSRPYYDAIEREVGVCGNRDGLEDLPDGVFLPPVPLKCSDEILKRAAASLGATRSSTFARPR